MQSELKLVKEFRKKRGQMQRELDEVSLIQIKYFLRTDNKARCTCLNWQGATIKGSNGMFKNFAQKNLML